MSGLKTVQALARHHPELLQTKLHEICLVLAAEVLQTLSSPFLCLGIFLSMYVSLLLHVNSYSYSYLLCR